MDIRLLNGNVHRYKKEGCSGNFFILGCTRCPWQSKAFEVGEHSEVGALESLFSPKKCTKIAPIPILPSKCINRKKSQTFLRFWLIFSTFVRFFKKKCEN